MTPHPPTRPALCLSLISSVISEAEWMWSLNDLQIDSTLRQCLSPSMSSNCTLCEGVAFIGFSQHLILISMSDQSPLLSHFFLIGFRKLCGWRSSADYLDFSKCLSWGGLSGDCGPETHRTFASPTKYCVRIQEGWEEAIQADLQRC